MTSETDDAARASVARDRIDVALEELEPHPVHLEIYGEADEGLTKNLRQFGQQVPVKIDPERRVVSGNRRVKAARNLGWETIKAQEVDVEDGDEARRFILVANAYRAEKEWIVKYHEAREYCALVHAGEMERSELRELAKDQGEDVEGLTEPQVLACLAVGMKQRSYQYLRYVFETDACEAEITHAAQEDRISREQAEELQDSLGSYRKGIRKDNESPNTAGKRMRKALEKAREQHQMGEEARREKAWKNEAGRIDQASTRLREDIENLVEEAEELGMEDTSVLDSVEEDLRLALEILTERKQEGDVDVRLEAEDVAGSMPWSN